MSLIEQQLKLIDSSLTELEKLKKEVRRLEDIRKEIEVTKSGVQALPKDLMDAFDKVKTLSESFVESLGIATKNYIDGNNNLLNENLKGLSKRNEELEKQIERLEKIDLEKHFDKHQKTLSEIFGAINGINITLTSVTQSLSGVSQSLGLIQNIIDTNQREVIQAIGAFSETTSKHLSNQDYVVEQNVNRLEEKILSLSEQNVILKNYLKRNRIIQILGMAIIMLILIYLAVK